jgi:3-oxoacyl-[acyl-carrier protein] reductase
MDFSGKVVFVTGSSLGIGSATAKMFAKSGANVVVHCNESVDAANDVLREIEGLGRRVLLVRGDVADKLQVEKMVEQIRSEFGFVDILVNNAGSLVKRARFEELDEDLWDRVMDVNLKSVYLVSKSILPIMKPRGGGRIINLTSVAARHGGGLGSLVYAASKGGVATLTRGMAKDLAEYNILVNAVAPGIISTPFHDRFSPAKMRQAWAEQIPLHREGTPEETAGAILFLASSYANYITGQIIDINGGQWFS